MFSIELSIYEFSVFSTFASVPFWLARVSKTSTKVKLKSKSSGTQTNTQKELSTTTIDTSYVLAKSYEYDILVVDNVFDVDDIKSKLNEFGNHGWEVCGFQVIQKVFGCQAIIIMKKGLN